VRGEGSVAVTEGAEAVERSVGAWAEHVGILAGAGLITQEKRGGVKWWKVELDALRAARVWIQGFGQFEPVNLDAFERFLETERLAQIPDR